MQNQRSQNTDIFIYLLLPSYFSCFGAFSWRDLQFFLLPSSVFFDHTFTRLFIVFPVYAWWTNSVQMQTKVTLNTEQNIKYEEKTNSCQNVDKNMLKKNQPSSIPQRFCFPLQPEIPWRLHQTETVKWEQDSNWPQWLWMVWLRVSVKVWQSTSCVALSWYMKNRVGGRAWKLQWRRANRQFCVTPSCPS